MKITAIFFILILLLATGCLEQLEEKNGKLFFALKENKNLSLYDSHGNKVHKEVSIPTNGIHQIALSPDGSKMAIVYSNKVYPNKQGLYVYDFETTILKQVTNDKNALLMFASCARHNNWSPDGTQLLFEVHQTEFSKSEQNCPEPKPIATDIKVYNVKTKSIKHILTYMYKSIGANDEIWWTKDGKGIYYLTWYPPSNIKRIDISTGNTKIVFNQEDSTLLLSDFVEDYNKLWVSGSDKNNDKRDSLYTVDLKKGTVKKWLVDANNQIESIYAHSNKILLKSYIKEKNKEFLYIFNTLT